jgi:hypothetical protein
MKTYAMKNLLFVSLLLIITEIHSQSIVLLTGIPSLLSYHDGTETLEKKLSGPDVDNKVCKISKIGDRYFWASRDNLELFRSEEGSFVTFFAVNGAGYVRVIKANERLSNSALSNIEHDFDYVEHIIIGLRSNTYYGKIKR